MSEAMGDRAEMERRLIERSLQDDAFSQRLLEDPKATMEKSWARLPADVRVMAVEETADTIYLVLPSASRLVKATSSQTGSSVPCRRRPRPHTEWRHLQHRSMGYAPASMTRIAGSGQRDSCTEKARASRLGKGAAEESGSAVARMASWRYPIPGTCAR